MKKHDKKRGIVTIITYLLIMIISSHSIESMEVSEINECMNSEESNNLHFNEMMMSNDFQNDVCFIFARIEGPIDTDRYHLPGGTNVPLVYDHLTWTNIPGYCYTIGPLGNYQASGLMIGRTDFTIGFVLPTILEPGYWIFGWTAHIEVQWA